MSGQIVPLRPTTGPPDQFEDLIDRHEAAWEIYETNRFTVRSTGGSPDKMGLFAKVSILCSDDRRSDAKTTTGSSYESLLRTKRISSLQLPSEEVDSLLSSHHQPWRRDTNLVHRHLPPNHRTTASPPPLGVQVPLYCLCLQEQRPRLATQETRRADEQNEEE